MSDRPPRPDPLPVEPDAVPDTLRERETWVCWRYEFDTDRDKWTKVPLDVQSGGYGDTSGPDTWVSFAEALAYHEKNGTDTDGVGFVVHDGDTVLGLDLDDCRDPETGEMEAWAEDVLDDVPTYAEVSPSGTGLRFFGLGFTPDGRTRADIEDAEGHIEMYDSGRYLTATGHHIEGTPEDVRQVNDEIGDVHSEYIADDAETSNTGDSAGSEADSPGANPTPDAGKSGSTDLSDSDLIEKAKDAENGDYFTDLWEGRWQKHTHRWQDDSHSEARQALANLLAFWTHGDKSQMLRLFRQSDLCRGDDDIRTFENYEIPTALDGRTDFYDPDSDDGATTRPNEPGEPNDDDGDDDSGYTYTAKLTPNRVAAAAGLGEDETVADLTDREKAACVWDIVWEHDDYHVRVRRDNGSLWAYDNGVWKPEGERELRHAARKGLGSMNYGQNVLTELKAQARSDPRAEVQPDELGLSPGSIAVENGLLDLAAAADDEDTNALRDLEPEDYALTRLPVEYDPDATADEWANYVDEWAEDGRADALQEYIGYCLHVGGLPIHRALLLVGSGANGKGTFLHVVRELLGRENTSSIELQTLANEKDAVADFYGALANIDDDLSARKLGAGLGMFKKLVGGDRVRARRLYEDGFEFDATGKHLYAANEVPQVDVDDEDEAFWRRWLLVEFPNHYPPSQRDPELREELSSPEQLSGVLNWAVDGWKRLLDQGHFTNENHHAYEKRERWQAWGDSMDTFISKCIERDKDADNISTGDVHRVYSAWCRENGEKPAGQQQLTTKLKAEDLDYGTSVRPGGTGTPTRGFKSLGFTDEAPDLEDTPERDDGDDPDDSHQDSLF